MSDEPTTEPENDPEVTEPETDPVTEPEAPEDEWTPPTREEIEAERKAHAEELAAVKKAVADQQAALKKANAESANRKKQLAELQKQHEDDETRAKREATEAALAQVKPVVIRSEAKARLLGANAKPDRVEALMELVNLSVIDIDGDSITGLDGEVERLAERFPEFFVTEEPAPVAEPAKPEKPRVPRIDAGARKPAPANKPQSFGEMVAQLVHGSATK